MAVDHIRSLLDQAHGGRYLVRVRAVNSTGNTVDIVGFVTAIREDGGIRLCEGDPERGQIHEFAPQRILGVERVHSM